MTELNLPAVTDALDEIEFFERERTERFYVELATMLYNSGVSLPKIRQVLGRLGVERSHVAIWKWVVRFSERLTATGREPVAVLPSRILLDETVCASVARSSCCMRRWLPRRGRSFT